MENLTREKIERTDHKDNLVDFVFCNNCITFVSIAGKKEGGVIICIKCRTDKYYV